MSSPQLEHDWFPRALPAGVMIGERSWLYSSFAFLHCAPKRTSVTIGHDSGIYDTSFFELGPNGSVEIGDYCAIVGAIFCCDCPVIVEDYAFIAHEVVIADTGFAMPPSRRFSVEGAGKTEIRIGRNSWIGARATILAGAEIGEGAIVGAGAVVDFQVPAFSTVAGSPARVVHRV